MKCEDFIKLIFMAFIQEILKYLEFVNKDNYTVTFKKLSL